MSQEDQAIYCHREGQATGALHGFNMDLHQHQCQYRCIQFLNIVINPTKYQNHNRFLEGNKKLKEQSKTIEISNLFHELI